jgi:hypothetical protein
MTPFITLAAAAAILAQVGQAQPKTPPVPATKPAAQAPAAPKMAEPKPQGQLDHTPGIPGTPEAIKGVISARPFTLTTGYEYDWRQERPLVTTGTLIVLEVDPNAVYPRQVAQPVLYVGNQTAERLNVGFVSGKVVAIVPGTVDLATAPIWFGTPMLPEQVDANTITVERDKADRAGIKPIGKDKAQAVTSANKLVVADKPALLREAAALIRTHSPDEAELADILSNQAQPGQGGGQPQR